MDYINGRVLSIKVGEKYGKLKILFKPYLTFGDDFCISNIFVCEQNSGIITPLLKYVPIFILNRWTIPMHIAPEGWQNSKINFQFRAEVKRSWAEPSWKSFSSSYGSSKLCSDSSPNYYLSPPPDFQIFLRPCLPLSIPFLC